MIEKKEADDDEWSPEAEAAEEEARLAREEAEKAEKEALDAEALKKDAGKRTVCEAGGYSTVLLRSTDL